ncbi:DMT family transporter [Candidatus Woesearchaeota archaeon]|nr:DMT family transporter [Candidatus Woesearchaeota archaeon]
MVQLGFLFGLVCMLTYGISKVLAKKALLLENPYKVAVFIHFFISLTLLSFVAATGNFAVPNLSTIPLFLLTAIIGAIAILSLYKGYAVGKISLLSPIMSCATIITVLLAVIFYKEFLTYLEVWGIIFAVVGMIFLSMRWSEWKKIAWQKIPGLKYALLTMLGWGFYFFLLKPIALEWGALLTATYMETAIFLCLLGNALVKKQKFLEMKRSFFLTTLLGGFFVAIGSLFFNLGIMINRVSVLMVFAQASLFITVILSFIFLKERLEKNQAIGVFLIVIGLLMVSWNAM